MNYVLSVYRKYAAFDGRATRTEYWAFMAFCIVVQTAVSMLVELGQGASLEVIGSIILVIFVFGSLAPAVAVGVRRLHDIDRTGYWILLCFLPIIGSLVLLIFSLLPGTKGANRYGQDPKVLGDDAAPVFT